MSQNPFGHPFDADPEPVGPPRTSGLAVGAFASCLICCLPLVGLIPTALGVPALISISRSKGRLTGRGLAVVGIVLGLLGQMFWCGGAIGLTKFFAGLAPLGQTMGAIDRGEFTTARPDLNTNAAALPDEQFEAFRQAYQKKVGTLKSFPKGLGPVMGAYIRVGPGWEAMDKAQRIYGQNKVIPMAAEFDQGTMLVLFAIDETAGAGPSGVVRVRNIGIADRRGDITWLIDPAAAGP